MRNLTRRIAFVAAGAGVASFAALAPASAGTTDATFTLTGGTLSINQPQSADLGSTTTGSPLLTGLLGTVTVTDARGANLGSYTAGVSGSAFSTGSGDSVYSISASKVVYTPPTTIQGNGGGLTAVRAPGVGGTLDAPRVAMTAVGVVGNNTSTWNPTIVVTLPSDAVAGKYTGTITHSVA